MGSTVRLTCLYTRIQHRGSREVESKGPEPSKQQEIRMQDPTDDPTMSGRDAADYFRRINANSRRGLER